MYLKSCPSIRYTVCQVCVTTICPPNCCKYYGDWMRVNITLFRSSFEEVYKFQSSVQLLTKWTGYYTKASICHRFPPIFLDLCRGAALFMANVQLKWVGLKCGTQTVQARPRPPNDTSKTAPPKRSKQDRASKSGTCGGVGGMMQFLHQKAHNATSTKAIEIGA